MKSKATADTHAHRLGFKNANAARTAAARKKRREMVAEIKLEKGCADCGVMGLHPESYDFDHVRGKKKFNISQATTTSEPVLRQEIAKCDVVCSNCHRQRTASRVGR